MDTEDDPAREVPGRTDADSDEDGNGETDSRGPGDESGDSHTSGDEEDDSHAPGNESGESGVSGDDAVASMYEQSGAGESPMAELRESIESGESDDGDSGSFEAPLLDQGAEPETSVGTFYVKYAQESAVTLHEVNTAQICTLIENPGFETHDIVEATLVAQPPMQVSYLVQELEDHYSVPVETSPEPPTQQVRGIATDIDVGQAVAIEREGEGEIHILRVDPEETERVAAELDDDEMTYKNAARYGVERVEIRTDEDDGVISIRYLP